MMTEICPKCGAAEVWRGDSPDFGGGIKGDLLRPLVAEFACGTRKFVHVTDEHKKDYEIRDRWERAFHSQTKGCQFRQMKADNEALRAERDAIRHLIMGDTRCGDLLPYVDSLIQDLANLKMRNDKAQAALRGELR